MVKNTPRANKHNKQDEPSPEITPATTSKRSKRRNSHEKQSAYRVMKRDANRDKRAKQDCILNIKAARNPRALNKKGADDNDDDDDDYEDDHFEKQSPAVPPHETPDTKRKLQPELETPEQQPIPVYDAATEARKAELDKAAKKWMADKEYESMGR